MLNQGVEEDFKNGIIPRYLFWATKETGSPFIEKENTVIRVFLRGHELVLYVLNVMYPLDVHLNMWAESCI